MPSSIQREAERAIKASLVEGLSGLRGVGQAELQRLVNKYSPRFAQLALMPETEARATYDDLLVNLEADASVAAIDAQTKGTQTALRVLRAVASLALSFVLPSLPAVPATAADIPGHPGTSREERADVPAEPSPDA